MIVKKGIERGLIDKIEELREEYKNISRLKLDFTRSAESLYLPSIVYVTKFKLPVNFVRKIFHYFNERANILVSGNITVLDWKLNDNKYFYILVHL